MKLAGIDLNGIHDYCMRSERLDAPENRSESKSNERPDVRLQDRRRRLLGGG